MRRTPRGDSAARGAAALAVALLAVLLAACGRPASALLELRLYSMGTWVDVAIESADERQATAALGEVQRMLRRFELDYYAWADGGELDRLNDAIAAGQSAEVSPELAGLLEKAQEYSALSGGVFDPAVGGLVELWGFHAAPPPDATPPPRAAIDEWLDDAPRIADVTIDGRRVRSANPKVKLDLGGIAKGEAVDRMLELLRRHGVRNALVNAGGDLRVIGTRNGRPWRIGIKSPRGEGVLGVIELADGEAAFTSGDYERFYDRDGRRMHHILDPRTGYPADRTQAITVVAPTGVAADAAATALLVGGDSWRAIAAALGIDAVLRCGASGEVEVTEPMRQRLAGESREESDAVADS